MNWWKTESSKTPATFTEGEFAGDYNPADIRGSYTFGEVSEHFEIPLDELSSAFQLPAETDAASFSLKDLETVYADLPVEVGTASVRMFVSLYKGLPYDLSLAEETYLFPEAASILISQGKMSPEQAAYLDSHLVPLEGTPAAVPSNPVDTQATDIATEHSQPDRTISGKTTFQDLLDWGMSQEMIEEILSSEMPEPQTIIKDYATQKGLEFSTIKTSLQNEVDKIN